MAAGYTSLKFLQTEAKEYKYNMSSKLFKEGRQQWRILAVMEAGSHDFIKWNVERNSCFPQTNEEID